jgi:ubiquinone/menaquinone biosynthesis C-methylase UbiE
MGESNGLSSFDAPATYDAGAVDYDKASSRYWSFFGERVVDILALQPGSTVLDVASGTGTSALPAAEKVGPTGSVIAVDTSSQMVALARQKANQRGLQNIEFHVADMTNLEFPPDHFDAVICVLGIFFVDDMAKEIAALWRLVRPGGRLGIATVGPRFFQPMYDAWKAAVRRERPDMRLAPPWERTNDSTVMRQLLEEAGVQQAEVSVEHNTLALEAPEEWWQIVIGTGLRRYVDDMGPEVATRVREDNLAWAQANEITSVELSAIYAVATKG